MKENHQTKSLSLTQRVARWIANSCDLLVLDRETALRWKESADEYREKAGLLRDSNNYMSGFYSGMIKVFNQAYSDVCHCNYLAYRKSDNDPALIKQPRRLWPIPSKEMRETPEFSAVWACIKKWDINVPDVYTGYSAATNQHVRAILDALAALPPDVKK